MKSTVKKPSFATCINCMDGRVQGPVTAFVKKRTGADYVDVITEPGPDKVLAKNGDKVAIASIKRRVQISVEKHSSKLIAIAGHHDCAGNPVDAHEHQRHIQMSIEVVRQWGFGVPILGIWIDEKLQPQEIRSSS